MARNTPYAGGHSTVLYGRVASGCHALQVEINRALYLDEDRIAKRPIFRHGAHAPDAGDRRSWWRIPAFPSGPAPTPCPKPRNRRNRNLRSRVFLMAFSRREFRHAAFLNVSHLRRVLILRAALAQAEDMAPAALEQPVLGAGRSLFGAGAGPERPCSGQGRAGADRSGRQAGGAVSSAPPDWPHCGDGGRRRQL